MKTFEERTAWMEKHNTTFKSPEDMVDTAKQAIVFHFGGNKTSTPSPIIRENFSRDMFFHRSCSADTYEFWCKLIWCITCKLKPLEKGKSYKAAVMDLCGVRVLGVN